MVDFNLLAHVHIGWLIRQTAKLAQWVKKNSVRVHYFFPTMYVKEAMGVGENKQCRGYGIFPF